jgi:alpha-N-arabinofuranosidase
VKIANIAQMVNVLQAMIFTKDAQMLLTPTYHVFKMYVPFQDATFLPVTFDAGKYVHGSIELPRVDAMAAKGTDGKLWVALVNLDPKREVTFQIDAGGKFKSAEGETLAAPQVNSVNTFEAPNAVAAKPFKARVSGGKVNAKLAPASLTVVALE